MVTYGLLKLRMNFVLAVAWALTLQATAVFAQNQGNAIYPQIVDTRHASEEVRAFFDSFFTAKSRHDVEATMEHFSPQLVTYTDATLGWPLDGFGVAGCLARPRCKSLLCWPLPGERPQSQSGRGGSRSVTG